ncbi:MAG: GNAT family N-acetyltransferase, partial [Betaproteobacteria bacterium]|nr:GNAT family N-acetyltransferase [Betaproteobacteria bacterium]
RLPTGALVGYVQATVQADGCASIAYELSSAYWGRGLATRAAEAMIGELRERYRVRDVFAVFKRSNHRSMRLLERLGFKPASPAQHAERHVEPGELLMHRDLGKP